MACNIRFTIKHVLLAVAALAASAWLSPALTLAEDQIPDGLKIVSLEVRPNAIELTHKLDYRQLLITGRLDSGESIDLTRNAKVTAGDQLTISSEGLVRPAKMGQTSLTINYGALSATVPANITGLDQEKPVSFVRDVQPVLSRMGCNQGTCHGSKEGKAGFKLSLRGYDPLYDHRALTDDIGARRFNRAAPDQSLLLLKATGVVPHVGGVRTNADEPYYNLVRTWISQGVKLDLDAPRVAKIEIFPLNPVLPRAAMKQQMTVTATFTDGTTRDVTREAFIESGNIEVIEANTSGVVTTLRRGEAPILVRYEGAYAATTIICMGDRTGFEWQQPPSFNYVDDLVYAKLKSMKTLASDICTDEEFLRRVSIDLTGLPPSLEDVRAFLADTRDSQVKRREVVDRLIGSREYVEYWTNKWADLLQVNRKFLGEEGALALRNWIKDSIATNKPYDQFAREVLTASGSTIENPPAAYYKIIRDPESLMENTTHLFLAVRFNCNKCHDHPFERWTQDQYYHLSAYFAQVGRKQDPNFAGQTIGGSAVEGATPLVEVVFDNGSGEVTHNRTGKVSPPSFPYAHNDVEAASAPRRQQLAKWITSKDNQYFAKSQANRLWGYMFGSGIIEPIDDIRAGNPPTNPELLDALTKDFIASGFDLQHMLRVICTSRTYQHSIRSNRWNEDDLVNYSHAIPRRLPAEVLYDSIHAATGSVVRLPGVPAGFRAAELPDAGISDPFLDDFGKPVRESACECERSSGMVLGPVLKLINGPTVANAVLDPGSALNQLVQNQPDDRKLIEEVFLRLLARRPTDREIEFGIAALKGSPAEYEKAVAALATYEKDLVAKQVEWEKHAGKPPVWTALAPSQMQSQAGAVFTKQEDNSIVVTGNLAKDVYNLQFATDLQGITGIRLEALADPSLKAGGPGRAQNGNFVVNELKLSAAPKSAADKLEAFTLKNGMADFSQDNFSAAAAADGNEGTGWAVSPAFGKDHMATFETSSDISNEGGSILSVAISQQFPDGTHALGRFRISVTTSPRPLTPSNLPAEITAALGVPADKRSPEQLAAVTNYFRSLDANYAQVKAAVAREADQLKNSRAIGVQDLAWALINSPAFLFNR